MSANVDIESVERLQVENILLKIRIANQEIEKQQSIINDWNRVLSMTISALRSKYKLGPSWKLDAQSFQFVKSEELVKIDPESTPDEKKE